MDHVLKTLDFYKSSYYNKFCRLAAPLKSIGVDFFCYTCMSAEGLFYQMSNHPPLAEYYFGYELYKANPCILNPDNFYDGQITIPLALPDDKFIGTVNDVETKFGISSNFITFHKKTKKKTFWLAFSSGNIEISPIALYLNYPEVFHRYIDYFSKTWEEYQPKMESFYVDMSSLLIISRKAVHKIGILENHLREQFFRKIGYLNEINFSVNDFTKRELDCIDSLLQGNTVFITVNNLDLSERTVQHYIENIKNKVGCKTKAELLNCLTELRKMSLL
jgi:DNA-binding CsgD family transcriptional regulator